MGKLKPFSRRERAGIVTMLCISVLVLALGFFGTYSCGEEKTDVRPLYQEIVEEGRREVKADTVAGRHHRNKHKDKKKSSRKSEKKTKFGSRKQKQKKQKPARQQRPVRNPLEPVPGSQL